MLRAPDARSPPPRPWGRLELQSGKAKRLLHILSQGLCPGPRPRAEMLTHSLGGGVAALTSPALPGGTGERGERVGVEGWRAVGRASGRRWEPQARPGAPGSECWADPGNRRKGRGKKERKLKVKRTEKAKGGNEEEKKNRSAWGQAVKNRLPTLFLGSLFFSWPSPGLGPPGRMCPCPWGQPASRMSLCFELT